MKKILLLTTCLICSIVLFAQDSTTAARKKTGTNLDNRNNDHFMIQLGSTRWAGKPDSIKTGGFSKSINIYFMFDYPFKTNPKLSMAFGPGIASDHIIFKKTHVGIRDQTSVLQFTNQVDTNHFKKTKLATVWLEAPVEFRYNANPLGDGFKWAIGVKVGTLLNAHTRNKDLQNKADQVINAFTEKEHSKKFFNGNRLSVMGRVGYGHFTLYGTYQVSTLLKTGRGADIRPYSIGITLSGL
jgi:hypothetical protein